MQSEGGGGHTPEYEITPRGSRKSRHRDLNNPQPFTTTTNNQTFSSQTTGNNGMKSHQTSTTTSSSSSSSSSHGDMTTMESHHHDVTSTGEMGMGNSYLMSDHRAGGGEKHAGTPFMDSIHSHSSNSSNSGDSFDTSQRSGYPPLAARRNSLLRRSTFANDGGLARDNSHSSLIVSIYSANTPCQHTLLRLHLNSTQPYPTL